MSDLIRREDALLILKIFDYDIIPSAFARQYSREMLNTLYVKLNELPSAESERTVKALKHKYWLGVSLNVVGETTIGYEWICENCKKKVINGDDYCSHCGSKLDWGENLEGEK